MAEPHDELLNPGVMGEHEEQQEGALRPESLAEFIGQGTVKRQLSVMLESSRIRNRPAEHVLLAGPPGLGKTTLSMIIAHEMDAPLRITSGPTITNAADLASILSSLQAGEVLFIDEIHRVSKSAAEMLYLAMEDFRVDVMVGKGPGATSIPLELAPFTLIGATTRSGLLPGPLRDRFGFTANMEFYTSDELETLLARSAALLDVRLPAEAAHELASRSRGTPRIANRLLRRVRDYLLVHPGLDEVRAVRETLALYEVDGLGLDRLDRQVLVTVIDRFAGGPVGLNTLAAAVGEEPETIESVVEPFLVREGLLSRMPRGRVATQRAYAHLGQHNDGSGTSSELFEL